MFSNFCGNVNPSSFVPLTYSPLNPSPFDSVPLIFSDVIWLPLPDKSFHLFPFSEVALYLPTILPGRGKTAMFDASLRISRLDASTSSLDVMYKPPAATIDDRHIMNIMKTINVVFPEPLAMADSYLYHIKKLCSIWVFMYPQITYPFFTRFNR